LYPLSFPQWDFYPGTTPVDLDASAVCFDQLGVVQDAVYFNQLSAFGGALKHSGDSIDGAGDGFDETIAFDVDKLPLNVNMVAIVVNAHDDGTDFTHVESASCVLQDFPLSLGGKPRQLADISIGCKGKNTGVVLFILIRKGADPRAWTVKAVGDVCAEGRNWNDCMGTIRRAVDSNLEEWVKHERTLSVEKVFNMNKGDSANIPDILSQLNVGLGWDCESSVDLDASVIVLGDNREVITTCSFERESVPDFGLYHQGDNTTGAGSGDDETIRMDLAQAASHGGPSTSLIVVVNVYSDGASFARSVKNAYVRLYMLEGNKELARYKLSDGAVRTRGLVFAEIYRGSHGWQLTAIGKGCGGARATSAETQTAAQSIRLENGEPVAGPPQEACCVVL
jgi:tellurium resistance protein TerD